MQRGKKPFFYLMLLWSQARVYLQQDQVDLGAPLLPSDLLGPEEKEERTHEDFIDIAFKPCVTLDQPLHLLSRPAFQQLHHQVPVQPGLSAIV